jgi:hypothetical protein
MSGTDISGNVHVVTSDTPDSLTITLFTFDG